MATSYLKSRCATEDHGKISENIDFFFLVAKETPPQIPFLVLGGGFVLTKEAGCRGGGVLPAVRRDGAFEYLLRLQGVNVSRILRIALVR